VIDGDTRISQRETKKDSCETDSHTHTIETHGAGAVLPSGSTRRIRTAAIAAALLRLSLEGRKSLRAASGLIRVHREDHTLRTVVHLPAVRPYRGGVVDRDGVRRERGSVSGNRHEARVEANLAACGRGRELLARRIEAGLREGVVLHMELKCDAVARLRGDIRGVVGQSVATNDDLVFLRSGRRRSCAGTSGT